MGPVGIHKLKLDVLVLQCTPLRKVRNGHAAALAFSILVGGLADAVPPARFDNLGSEFDFFQDADDLVFAEFLFLHVENPLGGNFSTTNWLRISRRLQISLIYGRTARITYCNANASWAACSGSPPML